VSDRAVKDLFDLKGRVAIITGGAGLLGTRHAAALAEYGAIPVLLDIDSGRTEAAAQKVGAAHGVKALGLAADITDPKALEDVKARVLKEFGRMDILVNNAANNPKMEGGDLGGEWTRLENFPLKVWNDDIAVGLTGAMLCSQVFGAEMAKAGQGVILNIASDLGAIAPDQRLYRKEGLADEAQPVKPVTYSVVKSGLIGLTRYLATYWADKGVRANALLPGGVENSQDPAFIAKLTHLIPMGRMAQPDEYKAAVLFLVSDASSYMTGAMLSVDGGRTAW
jgi:NAD(P)-dependent dehydrogenase (short-subunit alcohol dehydrogenase family)